MKGKKGEKEIKWMRSKNSFLVIFLMSSSYIVMRRAREWEKQYYDAVNSIRMINLFFTSIVYQFSQLFQLTVFEVNIDSHHFFFWTNGWLSLFIKFILMIFLFIIWPFFDYSRSFQLLWANMRKKIFARHDFFFIHRKFSLFLSSLRRIKALIKTRIGRKIVDIQSVWKCSVCLRIKSFLFLL